MGTGDQLKELPNDLYAAFSTGDARPFTEHAAEDVLGIGSDEDEWWQGRSVFTKVVTAQMQEISSSGGRLIAGAPKVFEQGDVAWVVDRPLCTWAMERSRPCGPPSSQTALPGRCGYDMATSPSGRATNRYSGSN